MKRLKAFFLNKYLWLNILLAIAFLLLLFWGAFKWLDWMTDHGESVTVPDLKGMTLEEVDEYLANKQLRYKIMDSTYNSGLDPHEVYSQNPREGSKVKENRNIYIAINALNAPNNKVPNLERKSYETALNKLRNEGFKVGEIIYKPDRFENSVIELQFNGKKLEPFAELPEGSVIDIVVGSGLGNPEVPVPNLIGLTLSKAIFYLQGYDLNIGYTVYDESVQSRSDTLDAVIFKQLPHPGEGRMMRWGEAIDVHLMHDEWFEAMQDTVDIEVGDPDRPLLPGGAAPDGESPDDGPETDLDDEMNDDF